MRVTAEGLVVALAAAGYLVLFNESKVELVACAALGLWALYAKGAGRGFLAALVLVASLAIWALFPLQANARLELWFNGLAAWADHPILGWGLGSFEWGYGAHRGDWMGHTILTTPNVLAGAAHNAIVQTLAELGLVGLACAAAVVFLVLRHAQDQNAKVALVLALGCMMVGFPEQNPFTAALMAVAAGMATQVDV
jgi:O-antigen ligase